MIKQDPFVEVFWKAYKSLRKETRQSLAARIVLQENFSENWIDHILIEKSRKEQGQDISLDEYLKARKETEIS